MMRIKSTWTVCVILWALSSVSSNSSAQWPNLSIEELVAESALIGTFRAKVVDRSAYDSSVLEARTRVVLVAEDLIYGTWQPGELEFLLPEGTAPDGTEEVWSDTPKFTEGERYVIFVREGDWHVTPVVAGTRGVFRVTRVANREILVNDDGRAVVTLDGQAFRIGGKVSESGEELEMRRRGLSTAPHSMEQPSRP